MRLHALSTYEVATVPHEDKIQSARSSWKARKAPRFVVGAIRFEDQSSIPEIPDGGKQNNNDLYSFWVSARSTRFGFIRPFLFHFISNTSCAELVIDPDEAEPPSTTGRPRSLSSSSPTSPSSFLLGKEDDRQVPLLPVHLPPLPAALHHQHPLVLHRHLDLGLGETGDVKEEDAALGALKYVDGDPAEAPLLAPVGAAGNTSFWIFCRRNSWFVVSNSAASSHLSRSNSGSTKRGFPMRF